MDACGEQLTGTCKGFYLHDLRYTVGNISSTVVKIEMDARMVRFFDQIVENKYRIVLPNDFNKVDYITFATNYVSR